MLNLIDMLHYEKFQVVVLREVGEDCVGEWKHLLPAIPVAHRLRFLHTIRQGFSIPASFDMVMMSQTIMDDNYALFVQQAQASKQSRQNSNGMFTDRFSISD